MKAGNRRRVFRMTVRHAEYSGAPDRVGSLDRASIVAVVAPWDTRARSGCGLTKAAVRSPPPAVEPN